MARIKQGVPWIDMGRHVQTLSHRHSDRWVRVISTIYRQIRFPSPWMRWLGVGLSAAAVLVAGSPWNAHWVVSVSLIPLFYAVFHSKHVTEASLMGWGHGLLVSLGYHTWMWTLTAFAPWPAVGGVYAALAIYLGLWFGVATGAGRWLADRVPGGMLHVGMMWAVMDMARTWGPLGTPSGSIGMAWGGWEPFNQMASLIGVSGMVVISSLIQAYGVAQWRRGIVWALLVGVGWWGVGHLIWPPNQAAPITVGLVQANHAQTLKMEGKDQALLADYVRLSRPLLPHHDVIVWPETSLLYPLLDDAAGRKWLANQMGNRPLLMGVPALTPAGLVNAVGLIDGQDGRIVYEKKHLMPFGEYWPLAGVWRALGLGDVVGESFVVGQDHPPFEAARAPKEKKMIRWGAGICLEAIYPGGFRSATLAGATALVVVANNAWFFDSPAGVQLRDMARLRAIENRRDLVFCSNSGPSGVIEQTGRVAPFLPVATRGVLSGTVRPHEGLSLYTRWGDWLMGVMVIGWVILIITSWPYSRRHGGA